MSLHPAFEPSRSGPTCRSPVLRLRPPAGRSTAAAVILLPSPELTAERIDVIAGRLQAAGFFVAEAEGGLEAGRSPPFEDLLDQLDRESGIEGRRYGLVGLGEQAGLALHLAAAYPDCIGALAALGLHDASLALVGHARDLAERITAQVYITFDPALETVDAQARERLKRAFLAADVWYECANVVCTDEVCDQAGAQPDGHWDRIAALLNCALKPWD